MFPAEVATELAGREPRAVVTENVVDFVRLVQDRMATGGAVPPVIFVLKSNLPRDAGRLGRTLADRLDAWTDDHPDPFPTAYWL
jgi:hypothetical protein